MGFSNPIQLCNKIYGEEDESLAIDGKVMCNAIDKNGKQTHIMSVIRHNSKCCYTQKKQVGTIPMDNNSEEVKQTNVIKVAASLLNPIEIENKDITADALHTQREFAAQIMEDRKANYYFTVKENQPTLLDNILLSCLPAGRPVYPVKKRNSYTIKIKIYSIFSKR
jgi:hypothetical protein